MLFSPRVIGLTLFSCLLALALSLRAMPEEDSLSLAVYHKGERAANLPAVFPQARPFTLLLHARQTLPSDASALACANLFAAVDKLTGLQYYSHSEKKMTTLFMESVVLEHPRAREHERTEFSQVAARHHVLCAPSRQPYRRSRLSRYTVRRLCERHTLSL